MRSVEIYGGMPPDEELSDDCEPETLHAAKEGWVVFAVEDDTKNNALITRDWDSVVNYAKRWLMGDSIEEIEKDK